MSSAIGVLIAFSTLAAGCSSHNVAAYRSCPLAARVVAVSDRGAVGMARIGLTPEGLKRQTKCR
jgi:hypothetical protein